MQDVRAAPLLPALIVLRLIGMSGIEVRHLGEEAPIGLIDFLGDVQELSVLGGRHLLPGLVPDFVLGAWPLLDRSPIEINRGLRTGQATIVVDSRAGLMAKWVNERRGDLWIRPRSCAHIRLGCWKKLRMSEASSPRRLDLRRRDLLPLLLPHDLAAVAVARSGIRPADGDLLALEREPRALPLRAGVLLDAGLVQVLRHRVLVVREGAVVVDVPEHVLVREEVLPDLLGAVEELGAALARLEEGLVAPRVLEGLLVERAIILEEAGLVDLVMELNVVLAVISVVKRQLRAGLRNGSSLSLEHSQRQ